MERRLFLDVIIRKSTSVFELLASKNEALLIGRDAFLILNLRLHVINSVGRFDFKGDGLAGQRLDEDLHTTAETENEMEGRFFLDIVVGQGAPILELLAGEDQSLLVGWDSLLILDLRLNVVDGVRRLDFEGDGLAGERFDENLHAATKTENEMEGGFFLDVVVGEGAAVLELFAGEDEALLIWGDTLLVLDLGFDVVDRITRLDFESDGLASKGLDEDLHATTETEDKMEGALLLDVVIGEGAAVF